MTRFSFHAALAAVLLLPSLAQAETTPDESAIDAGRAAPSLTAGAEAGSDAELEVDWDQFDDPSFDPAAATPTANETFVADPSDADILRSVKAPGDTRTQIQLEASTVDAATRSGGIVLGPLGVDDLGRAGRLHTVAKGDTLWDLAAAYLGTPWVWPSVWIDNDDIANPHLILPGNKIWITANEMRVVTDAEAESFLTTPVADAMPESSDSMADSDPVAALDDSSEMFDDLIDEPSTLEAFPIAMPGGASQASAHGRRVTVARREQMGFVSAEKFAGSSSIVGSPLERIYLSAGDDVILGMGEGDVEIGDQFSIFTVIEEVRDPETLRLLGHHVDPLGWAQIKELTGDTSIAEIRTAYAEIGRGARVIRREPVAKTVEVRSTPDVIEGEVVFLPAERTIMADGGYVYLNRGEFHGVEVGSELEVFDPGVIVGEPARRVDVRTPDSSIARLVVVSVEPDSSVAFVLWSKRELAVGDTIRPVIPRLAQR